MSERGGQSASSGHGRPSGPAKEESRHTVRVLYVESATDFGGAVLSLSELVARISSCGVEPFVLTFQRPDVAEGLFAQANLFLRRSHVSYVTRARVAAFVKGHRFLRVFTTPIMKLYAVVDYVYGYYLSALIWWLLRRHRIDILHTNNAMDINGLRAAAWAGVPCVAHMRGMITGKTSHVLRTARRHVARSFRKAIAVSDAVHQSGLARGLTSDQLVTIYNPIDVTAFDRAEPQRDAIRRKHGLQDKLVVGAFGRVNRFKGQYELLTAVARLTGSCDALEVLVVGDASDSVDHAYWTEVQALAGTSPLRGRVTFVGYQKDVAPYYHASDIVVHSAIGADAFGRVVMEGMACRKPVIASDVGGPREIVTHGVDGLLVPPKQIDALADAIRRLARSEDDRHRMGEAGRRAVEVRFAGDVIARQVADVYRNI